MTQLNSYRQKISTELKEKGFTDDQIKKIKDYKNEFNKKFLELNKHDDQFLKLSGYTDEQINTIKNYDGTEEQMYVLSATLTTTLTTINTYKSSSNSYVVVDYDWNWSSEPVYELTDMVAFAWSQGFATNQDQNETYMFVYRQSEYNPSYSIGSRINTNVIHPGNGVDFKFDFNYYQWEGNDYVKYWTKEGHARVKMIKQALIEDVEVAAGYGHTIYTWVTPSVSIPAGLSFTWATGMEQLGRIVKYIDL